MTSVRLSQIFWQKNCIGQKIRTKWNTGGITDETAARFFRQPLDLGADLLIEGRTGLIDYLAGYLWH